MSNIKNSLIKIAYENPELRKELLPLITKLAVQAAGYEVDASLDISDFGFEHYRADSKDWNSNVSRMRWHAKGKISLTLTKDGKEVANVQNKDWSTNFSSGKHRSEGGNGAYMHSYSVKEYLEAGNSNKLRSNIIDSLLVCATAALPKEVYQILDKSNELDINVNELLKTDISDGLHSKLEPALKSLDLSAHDKHNQLSPEEKAEVARRQKDMQGR